MTEPERLIWATTFSLKLAELQGESYFIQIPRAVNAAYRAVDALRATKDLIPSANEKYAREKEVYNSVLPVGSRKPAGQSVSFTSAETEPAAMRTLADYLNIGDI